MGHYDEYGPMRAFLVQPASSPDRKDCESTNGVALEQARITFGSLYSKTVAICQYTILQLEGEQPSRQ
jgi:hypothetical protein